MSRRRRPQAPPRFVPTRFRPQSIGIPNLLELDRFSEADLERWNRLSKDLDELNAILYSGIEPQRQRHHDDLIAALRSVSCAPVDITGWVRIVTLRYADTPLAATGSLKGWGGRFNIGADVDNAMRAPWPALYIASDFETAYREKFGMAQTDHVGGLTADELALQPGQSHTVVRLDGRLSDVIDLGQAGVLEPVCKVLRKIRLPAEAVKLRSRLKIPRQQVTMIRTATRLMREVLMVNWRTWPAQFGNPAVSQILGSLIVDAGFEAIRYPSTKGSGECLAVFPHCLASMESFVELADAAPASVRCTRMDLSSAETLCGWETLPSRLRSAKQP